MQKQITPKVFVGRGLLHKVREVTTAFIRTDKRGKGIRGITVYITFEESEDPCVTNAAVKVD